MLPNDLPDVTALSGRLNADNARIASTMESLAQRVLELLEATRRDDLTAVQRLSESLGESSTERDTIRYRAEQVAQQLAKPNNLRGIKRSVVRLIAAVDSRESASSNQDAT